MGGGRNRTRTCDPIDVNDVLYHSGSSAWKNYGGFRPTSEPLTFELMALYHISWPDAIGIWTCSESLFLARRAFGVMF